MKKPTTDKEKVNLILSGKVQLVNLSHLSEREKSGIEIEVVKAHFCHVDFLGYKANPSSSELLGTIYFITLNVPFSYECLYCQIFW